MTLTVTELLAELAQGESQHREFKRQLDHPESVAGEIVAFANSDEDATGRELLRIARAAGELHYDRKALGEAVVNAIAHRDYSLSGSQIRVFVFADRVEVRSPGRPPNAVTLENIRLGVHAERNRRLATLLTQLGQMSAIGTGIPRLIIRLSRQLSGREPEFALVGEELRVRIWARSPLLAE
jgi:predicted HTH transcriptional regulator